jgi:hypothetical protein
MQEAYSSWSDQVKLVKSSQVKSSLITLQLVTFGHNLVLYKVIKKIACLNSEKSDFNHLINSKFSQRWPPSCWKNLI